jgi:hypothetical protein
MLTQHCSRRMQEILTDKGIIDFSAAEKCCH